MAVEGEGGLCFGIFIYVHLKFITVTVIKKT